MHWESYLLLQDLKGKKYLFWEITCDFFLGVGSAPLPVVKSGRQPSVLHGYDYLQEVVVLLLLSVTVKEVLISTVSIGFWSPTFLDQEGERRLCLLGGKCFCPILSPIREKLQTYKSERRMCLCWIWLKNVPDGLG